jgi:D-beta-D-heptose 7-phosphate kinase/D-beta-D-heptose 1-phosphate adenosyltransferase
MTRELARRWQGATVVVLGDVLLDRWLNGTPTKLAREAPAPVLDLDDVREACGGAANTAANLAALGATPILVGAVGDDPAGRRLCRQVATAGIVEALSAIPGRQTVTKSRVVADGHILARIDDGDTAPLDEPEAGRLYERLTAVLPSAAALIVCDYGTGTLTPGLLDRLVADRDRLPLLVVDAHAPDRWRPVRPALTTPSFAELGTLVPPVEGPDRAAAVAEAAPRILAATGATVAAVTLDRDGAVVLGAGRAPHRTCTRPAPAGRTAGAGDAYAAAFTLGLLAGADPAAAGDLAQRAATAAIDHPGTCVCPLPALLTHAPVTPTARRPVRADGSVVG